MEGFLEHYNRDSVRNTIIKHEEIFRHQVHELHRLYRVQKMLMAEIGSRKLNLQCHRNATPGMLNSATSTTDWISLSTSETSNISHVSDAYQATDHKNSECRYLLQSSNRSNLNPKDTHKGFDLEKPAEDFSSTEAWTFGKQLKENSKFKCPHNPWPDDESGIQLTLSIACGTDKKRSADFSASKY